MEVDYLREEPGERPGLPVDVRVPTGGPTREQMITRLSMVAGSGNTGAGLRILTEYVGASLYLLARYDLVQETGLDFVVCSNWPFDLVRRVEAELATAYARTTELDKCQSLLQPRFALLPDDAEVPAGVDRHFCSLTFNVGRTRLALLMLFPVDVALSPDRLREVGLLAGYCVSLSASRGQKTDREFELTDRELECLYWIAEGKTSDEIAMILGISRNTINNYITSVMRKTATKTRSEAIAYAVRNNLV
ncbi:helix-turn-helix domain-containing protein [Pseudomonas sp. R2.Fl]|nr:helix-turn-helix domain-containing protein [Pseudomonas sp. R2.Fl]